MEILVVFILSLIILLTYIIYKLNKNKEGFLNDMTFVEDQEKYYEKRDNVLQGVEDSEAEKFYEFDTTKPIGKQLIMHEATSLKASVTPNIIDEEVKKCKNITSCKELDGTNCGYCFSSNTFSYGDKNGPYADVCESGWVTSNDGCEEHRERAICDKIKNCKDMVGEASVCGWCPTSNKAMPFTKKGGILVPKYPDKDK